MKEFHQRQRLTIQNTFLFSTIKSSRNLHMLLLLSIQFLLSISVSFPSIDISSLQGWPHCGSLILSMPAFPPHTSKYTVRSVAKLHWSGTQINLISLNKTRPEGLHLISFLNLYDFIITITRCDFVPQLHIFGSKTARWKTFVHPPTKKCKVGQN